MDLITILLTVVSLVTAGLSLFIIRGVKSEQNKIFSLFVLSIALWSFGLLLFRLAASSEDALNYSRFYYIAAAAIATFFLRFSYVFPKDRLLSVSKKLFLYSPLILIALGILIFPHFILETVTVNVIDSTQKQALVNWALYILYSVYFIACLVIAYINLFRVYLSTKDPSIKIQLKFIFIGTIPQFILAMYFDLILPPFNYHYVWAGPLFAFFVVWALLYAVYKHHLLHAKVITTEVITPLLWIVILIRILISNNYQDRMIEIGLFVLAVAVGILVIHSVQNEVHQREKIEVLAQDLKKSNEGQENLIHIMNHQIKGFLGNNRAIFAELLTNDYGVMPETAKVLINEGLEQTGKGVEYVQDILRSESAQKGSLSYDMKPVDLKPLVLGLLSQEKKVAESQGLTFESSITVENCNIIGDATQLEEAFKNLITNAIKYNSPHGIIKVNLTRNGGKVIFSVKDTGVGISEEDKPRLFTAGGMGKNSLKINSDSSGFGLAFVKGVVEAHKGTCRVSIQCPWNGHDFFC